MGDKGGVSSSRKQFVREVCSWPDFVSHVLGAYSQRELGRNLKRLCNAWNREVVPLDAPLDNASEMWTHVWGNYRETTHERALQVIDLLSIQTTADEDRLMGEDPLHAYCLILDKLEDHTGAVAQISRELDTLEASFEALWLFTLNKTLVGLDTRFNRPARTSSAYSPHVFKDRSPIDEKADAFTRVGELLASSAPFSQSGPFVPTTPTSKSASQSLDLEDKILRSVGALVRDIMRSHSSHAIPDAVPVSAPTVVPRRFEEAPRVVSLPTAGDLEARLRRMEHHAEERTGYQSAAKTDLIKGGFSMWINIHSGAQGIVCNPYTFNDLYGAMKAKTLTLFTLDGKEFALTDPDDNARLKLAVGNRCRVPPDNLTQLICLLCDQISLDPDQSVALLRFISLFGRYVEHTSKHKPGMSTLELWAIQYSVFNHYWNPACRTKDLVCLESVDLMSAHLRIEQGSDLSSKLMLNEFFGIKCRFCGAANVSATDCESSLCKTRKARRRRGNGGSNPEPADT